MNEHIAFIKSTYKVLAEDPATNSIFFETYGEKIAEINGRVFDCDSVEDFHELVEMFGDETFEE